MMHIKFLRTNNRLYQYLAAITANLGIVCSEMHYGWPSPSLPILTNDTSTPYTFTITSLEGSWLTVIPLLGAIVGALITGWIVDICGRKNLVIFSSFPFIVSWLMIAYAKSSTLMFIGRFIAGMTDGLSFTAVPMYLSEIAEPSIRGLVASVCPVSIIFGILLINALGSYLPIDTTALIAVTMPALLLVTFVWMPESPYFYLMKNKTDDARESLVAFRGTKDVEEELNRISEAVEEQNRNKGSCLDLLTVKTNRKALVISFGLRGIQQLSGTTAIIFYCKTIFEESRDFISPSIATIIYFSVQLVLSVLSSFIVDFSGRRPLLIISIAGSAVTLAINGVYLFIKRNTDIDTSDFSFVPIAALLCYVVVFSIGLQTIPLLILGEMFPTNVKAFALCLADVFYSVVVTIISKFFHWAKDEYGLHVPFFVFACCCMLGLVFIVLLVPETKGKTLEDIQNELQDKKLKRSESVDLNEFYKSVVK